MSAAEERVAAGVPATHGYALTLEYDGTDFDGWQRQPGRRTVEGTLLAAIASATGETVRLTAAGRTDAGAHAHAQVAACVLRREWDTRRLRAAVNAHLPEDVVVTTVSPAPDGFHPRFDALDRTYRYIVAPRDQRAAVGRGYAWRVVAPLDVAAMREAATRLVGRHDFAALGRPPKAGGSTVRTVHEVRVQSVAVQGGRRLVTIDVVADAFLYGMMRAIAGALVSVGSGRLAADRLGDLVRRPPAMRAALPVAPAHGLHQWAVRYRERAA